MSAPSFDLAGRVCLVTGGSRGLGRAMVHSLAAAGADIAVVSRDGAACEVVARDVADRYGVRAVGLSGHVGRWDDLERVLDTVGERLGDLRVLVNNAGMSPLYDSAESITEDLFDKVIDVNMKGPFRLAALAGARMKAAGGGSIINISSAGSIHPRPHILPYAAAKAGLNAITVGLAHTYGPEVRVNAVIAGTFMTDVSKSWDEDAFARRAGTFAARRGGQPEEITGMVVYLASDASSYTTGALLTVDGGQP